MDKIAVFWGLGFGGLMGYLLFRLEWCMTEDIVKVVDTGYRGLMGTKLSGIIGGAAICTLLGAGIGTLIGVVVGSGRTTQ